MIRIRLDDIMVDSSSWPRERAIRRVDQMFRLSASVKDKITFIPTVLVTEIQEFPEIIELVNKYKDIFPPQLHGFQHIDYKTIKTKREVIEHFERSFDFFENTFNQLPTIFATPWGANSPHLREVANSFNLILEDTSQTIDIKNCMGTIPEDKTILIHWWIRGSRYNRLIEKIQSLPDIVV